MTSQQRAALRQVLTTRLNLSELQALCFDLELEYENLTGDTRELKVIALLKALEQQNRLDELRRIGPTVRPDLPWDNLVTDKDHPDDDKPSTLQPKYLELDKKVFQRLNETLPWNNSIAFARNHYFANPFPWKKLDDFYKFWEVCEDPAFEFINPDLGILPKTIGLGRGEGSSTRSLDDTFSK